jgi:hypothetical protein
MHFDEKQSITFGYAPGDILRITEFDTCIVHLYSIQVSNGASANCDTSAPLQVDDLSTSGGCGPVAVGNADVNTVSNCDRDYFLGSEFQAFFDAYGSGKTLVQDAHDPNDFTWDDDQFATITVPAGMLANLYLFVPVGTNAGHAHTAAEMPNVVDPRSGWEDTGLEYTEANGILRHLWTKQISGGYELYHSVNVSLPHPPFSIYTYVFCIYICPVA